MATATVQMLVSIEVNVNVSEDTVYSQFYAKASAAAMDRVKGYAQSGMELKEIVEVSSVIAKTTPGAVARGSRVVEEVLQ